MTAIGGADLHRPCPKCGEKSPLRYSSFDYYKKVSCANFKYYRCPRDHLIFLSPFPSNIGEYYPKSYYDLPLDWRDLDQRAKSQAQWKLDTVADFSRSGTLLEIGPAYGLFSHLAKQNGFDVSVIEMDSGSCEFLRKVVGADVVETGDVVGALRTSRQFDVIVMWQVIEHLADPWAVLSLAAERLNPGGVLILDTPNPGAFQFRILGKRWVHLDPPRHLHLIPWPLMVDHLEGEGLKLETITTADVGANGYNGFGWAVSFENLFSNAAARATANTLGRLLGKALIPIERTGKRGSTYTAIFRKEMEL